MHCQLLPGHIVSALGAAAVVWTAPSLLAQDVDPALYSQLHYRHIGPVGNRVSAVVGVPGDPMTYYAGAASGGVWKTTDAGLTWEPVFDDQPVHSI
nr:hypothetical protein [Gemmatimonadales bacterium]